MGGPFDSAPGTVAAADFPHGGCRGFWDRVLLSESYNAKIKAGFLSRGSEDESAPKPIQVVGQTRVLVGVGLRSRFLAGSRSLLVETACIFSHALVWPPSSIGGLSHSLALNLSDFPFCLLSCLQLEKIIHS